METQTKQRKPDRRSTRTDAAILTALRDCPVFCLADLGEQTGIRAKCTLWHALQRLERAGRIRWLYPDRGNYRRVRDIEVVEPEAEATA